MSDCMTQEDAMNMNNEQAIQILKPMRDMMVDMHGCPISDAYFALGKAIDAMSKIPSAHQWIPLSERWPDDDGVYLVTYKGVTNVALFAWGGWTIGTEDGMGQALPDAWMPLPEPYKGEADGPIR